MLWQTACNALPHSITHYAYIGTGQYIEADLYKPTLPSEYFY